MNLELRNIAIIAHVDHGKTTLVDKLLEQSKNLKHQKHQLNRVMDSNILEKERGITILSKHASLFWKQYKINIIDTPGHADFGGEVERVMSMVDSVLLIVDAIDGPMPQTRFVTQKAFNYNIQPIVIINKIDRENARPEWVLDQILDLFISLDANDMQLDFPVVYTSAIQGISGIQINDMKKNMDPLFETIIKYAPAPNVHINGHLKMQVSQLDYDNYLGTIGIGKIQEGKILINQNVKIINTMNQISSGKINKILTYVGLERKETAVAQAGEIVGIAGPDVINISDTICDNENIEALPKLNIDKPTVKMFISVNTSPFCGIEGKFITSRQIYNRLHKEAKHNIALKVEETKNANTFCISGRGELHLSILIENMRREGFEMEVSRPNVIFKKKNELEQEPYENVTLDILSEHQGTLMQLLGNRKGKITDIFPENNGRVRMNYILSSRSLIGFRNDFLTLTSGTGLFFSAFSHYDTMQSNTIGQRKNGVLISNKQGHVVSFALFHLQDRGKLFVIHGEKVYEGQIIGIHNRNNDLTVNCLTGKKLTNMRASGSDEAIILTPPLKMSLEQAIGFINDDELIEVTPKAIRLRKRYLTETQRKKFGRNIKN
ncbi:translational GTPase TypA [Buchnera aphidicola (Thelaxes californica)]|uniref:50S ribosomal subunit assembly factor BipA n=1 Tax=Buchnera aphidicola (Thelaxes californica) TaxID=1315998 RepID=A0A4D6YBW6_9GAMM|nr:translational GTPase TypA [Buchnera aphidicola]QCI26859.1 translational GTPase TypA [Buchnera aphidicola (Thelaxes californica)]